MFKHIDNFILRKVRKIINFWNSLRYNDGSREGRKMASIFDVADFILEEKGTVTEWQNGPVCRELYNYHQGWCLQKGGLPDGRTDFLPPLK